MEDSHMDTSLTILVVDDERTILDIFKEYLLSSTGHTVLTADSGLKALEIVENQEIDCCFTDISMPGMDGVELSRRIHQHDNTIQIVVMTGYPSLENAVETLKHGAVDFLTKPITMQQVLFTLEKIVRERSLLVDNIVLKEEARKNEKLLQINLELQEKIREVEMWNLILHELDQAATSKDLFEVLVNLAGEITSCSEAHFRILTEGMDDFPVITSFPRDRKDLPPESGPIVDKSILRKVAEEGMPHRIRGYNGTRSYMAIPLKIRSKVFGILTSSMREGSSCFSEKDLYFMNLLAEKASSQIENLALYENIFESLLSTLYAFVEAIEARDPYTRQHSARVSAYAIPIAQAIGCASEDLERLHVCGYLHDIGKIGIPDSILLKPGDLTAEEYEVIKTHPLIGYNIIGHLGMWLDEQRIIRHHHERFDGRGYPDGLSGDETPLLSRILSVADAYDALTSDRSYRKKMTSSDAIRIIRENTGSQFDPAIADIFLGLRGRGEIPTEP